MLFNDKALQNIMYGITEGINSSDYIGVRLYKGTIEDNAIDYVSNKSTRDTNDLVLSFSYPTSTITTKLLDNKAIFTFDFDHTPKTGSALIDAKEGTPITWGAIYASTNGTDIYNHMVLIGSAGVSIGSDIFRVQNEKTNSLIDIDCTAGDTLRLDDVTFSFEDS